MIETEFNSNTIDLIMDGLDITVAEARNKITLDFFTGVVFRTPVDTGIAKHSWNISILRPDKRVPTVGNKNNPPTPEMNDMSQQPAFCTSSLVYMPPLEDGHSKQGKHMVKRTIKEIIRKLPR